MIAQYLSNTEKNSVVHICFTDVDMDGIVSAATMNVVLQKQLVHEPTSLVYPCSNGISNDDKEDISVVISSKNVQTIIISFLDWMKDIENIKNKLNVLKTIIDKYQTKNKIVYSVYVNFVDHHKDSSEKGWKLVDYVRIVSKSWQPFLFTDLQHSTTHIVASSLRSSSRKEEYLTNWHVIDLVNGYDMWDHIFGKNTYYLNAYFAQKANSFNQSLIHAVFLLENTITLTDALFIGGILYENSVANYERILSSMHALKILYEDNSKKSDAELNSGLPLRIPAICSLENPDDLCHMILERFDTELAIVYRPSIIKKAWTLSIRSIPNANISAYDVAVCLRESISDGGGHKQASGCTIPFPIGKDFNNKDVQMLEWPDNIKVVYLEKDELKLRSAT